MSVWNPDNIRDAAEAAGIANLSPDVVDYLTRDVEFRLGQVIEKALKFMMHAHRTTMHTQDIALALRAFDVEPLYGYDSTRPLRFGEATIGAGQPLFFIEDDEVEFEKLINAPLPKVPRDISFTAHWLAVEGVQPSIPQNPSNADSKLAAMLPKGPSNAALAAMAGLESANTQVKPTVRHVLNKELQLYFDRVSAAVFDADNETFRAAAFASLRSDPGLQQLVPYFVHFVAEKVTHNITTIFVLHQACAIIEALATNPTLYLDPYVHAMIAPVFTCLAGKHLGSAGSTVSKDSPADVPTDGSSKTHFDLRDYAASLLSTIARKYSSSNKTLKPRLARSCLRKWLDPHKPLGTNYGGLIGIVGLGGEEVVRHVVLPNLALYDSILQDSSIDKTKQADVRVLVTAIIKALDLLAAADSLPAGAVANGAPSFPSFGSQDEPISSMTTATREQLIRRVGRVVGAEICARPDLSRRLIQVVLDAELDA